MEYKTLSYYKNFKCKCDKCRYSCCEYWNIAISLDEYIHLIGMDCKKQLREKLDETFSIVPDPTPERYAEVNLDLDGKCPLLTKDKFCGLQQEMGEKSIPHICDQYPRRLSNGFLTITNS